MQTLQINAFVLRSIRLFLENKEESLKDLQPLFHPADLLLRFAENQNQVRKEFPISWHLLRLLYNLYQQIKDVNERQGRQIITDHIAKIVEPKIERRFIYREFVEAIQAAKDFRQLLIREFVPDAVRFPLTSDGVINPTNDPLTLLHLMWNPPGDQRYRVLRSFTANVFWHLGLRYLLMRIVNKHPESQLRDLTLQLEKNFFDSTPQPGRAKETVNIVYDQENENRFVALNRDIKCDTTDDCLRLMLEYRFVTHNGRTVPLLYDSRVKKEDDIFRKTLVKSQAENPTAFDVCGITMVFFQEADLYLGLETLTDRIFQDTGSFSSLSIDGNGSKYINRFSDHHATAQIKFLVRHQGALIEVQMLLFPQYFNRRLSLGQENHHFYRLRQIIPLLECLFPKELFIDWQDPEILKILDAMQRQKIMTNYLGFNLPTF